MGEKDTEARMQELLQTKSDDPSHHFNLIRPIGFKGLLFWEKEDDESRVKAAEHFLISAKLNPQNSYTFRYLGHYYGSQMLGAPSVRAVKCYQRAVTLNPNDDESGEALCDMLEKDGKFDLEIAICKEASERSPRAFWATRRLGYFQVHNKTWPEAVQSLQHAIRGYPACANLWEALGLAYQRLGMFTAAIKSYGRALDLDKSRVFALVECGNTHLMLGFFRKGVEQFHRALEISPQNVSACYGLAAGLFGLSNECLSLGAFGWASSLLEEASKLVETRNCFIGNDSSLWKLHGDIMFTLAKCCPWIERGEHLTHREAFHASILAWKKNRYSAAISAWRSYQKALHLTPWQSNIYCDIGLASDLICFLGQSFDLDLNSWKLSEKMPLGGLLLDSSNCELWVTLGCLSRDNALMQHAFIRGLQLDLSSASAWAFLGKLYRKECKSQMAKKAFDSARSTDPSLALPWAGMAADSCFRKITTDEVFEDCLRAVQILPQADFQVGLVKIALLSNHLSSAHVFTASQQAVHCAPQNPESHNLNGLVLEARGNYASAAASFRLARFAIHPCDADSSKIYIADVTVNLARSFCKAGNALEAVCECEYLNEEGLLDMKGLQIYALSLWQLRQTNMALSIASDLSSTVCTMQLASSSVYVSFLCSLLYNMTGLECISTILKMPEKLFESSAASFAVSALHALNGDDKLLSLVVRSRRFVQSLEDIAEMHYLITLSKLLKHGSQNGLNLQSGVDHLRKALHTYPSSLLLRNLLGYLLMSTKGGSDIDLVPKCCILDIPNHRNMEGLRVGCEILGGGAVACYSACNKNSKLSYPACKCCSSNGHLILQQLQKWLHQEPWNIEVHYLVALNFMQKTREERYPAHLCSALQRYLLPDFYERISSMSDHMYQYQKLQLLLCASEICLQVGDSISSVRHAETASALQLPKGYLFFTHLMLCRVHHVRYDLLKLEQELVKCLQLKTQCYVGQICHILIAYQFSCGTNPNSMDLSCNESFKEYESLSKMWTSIYKMAQGLLSLRKHNILCAKESLEQACSMTDGDSCIFLCHGAICLELARQTSDSQFLLLSLKSLARAQSESTYPMPFISILLAQTVGSLGSAAKWERNLRLEWCAWRPGTIPAELVFQMHLVAKSEDKDEASASHYQNTSRLVIHSIHMNPACLRYRKVLQKLLE